MRYQTPNTPRCGPAALGNALRALGRRAPREGTLARLCGTKRDGTGSEGIIAAAHRLRCLAFEHSLDSCEARPEAASGELSMRWLFERIALGQPVICHVPAPLDHWVLCAGKIGHRLLIVDSTNTIRNRRENGVHVYTAEQWRQKWGGEQREWFAIAIAPK